MTHPGQIMIVDDDPEFVATYRDLLEGQGLAVASAHDGATATTYLEAHGPEIDVVLLDQKLHGRGGPDSGLELIARAHVLAPFAKVVLVTGYATAEAIERAFQLGAYDYLVKNGAFAALLRAKVRNAIEVTRANRRATVTRDDLVEAWRRTQTETDGNRKGKALEDLLVMLFRATPGFERVQSRLRNDVEEIDVTVENRSDDALWRHDGSPYLLAECKHWSKPCGARELRDFVGKLTNKYQRVRTAFFIAPGGFAGTFEERRREDKGGALLVIPVDGPALQGWIDATDRVAYLGELHRRAVLPHGA